MTTYTPIVNQFAKFTRMYRKCIISIFFNFISYSSGFKLLGIFPSPAKSHYTLGFKLMKGFSEAGHDVTFVGPYQTKDMPKNGTWTDIHLEELVGAYRERFKNTNMYEDRKRSIFQRIIGYQDLMLDWVNQTIIHPKIKALLESDVKFDAVVMEQFFNDAHKYFAYRFNCPLILMSSIGPAPWVNNIVANPTPPAYAEHYSIETIFSDDTTCFQRLYNLYYHIADYIVERFYSFPLHEAILQQAYPGSPSIDDLNKRASLVLVSSHASLMVPVPLVPSMVEIGGYHIDDPKVLPDDLQKFLDFAQDGVIYFSMGSNLKSKDMSEVKRRIFLRVFGKLKQRVIWKFEDSQLLRKPKNVMIKNWLPQNDILAHPNVKLFITHGGFLSTIETIYHGIPVLVIPVFADQFMNANKAVAKGYGLKLAYNDNNFTEENLYSLIQELLNNSKYDRNAKLRSKIFHDRPLKPMENAVYWLEYFLRHNEISHLKVEGEYLPLYKYFMLDVLLCLLGLIALFLHAIIKK